MPIDSGVSRIVSYKAQSTPLTLPSASGAQQIRRVSLTGGLRKDTYRSQEKTGHQQVAHSRHGRRRGEFTLAGELSPGTYGDFFAAMLRKTWAAGVSKSNTDFTSVAADNATSKFTVGASTWVAQGFEVGDVIRFATLSDAGNNAKNFRITALAGVDATVYPAPNTMAADTSFTVTVQGKKLWTPASGHTDDMFALEDWHPLVSKSYRYLDAKPVSLGLELGEDIVRCNWGFLGRNRLRDTTQYFTSPTAETTLPVLTAFSGAIRVAGADVALVTGLNLNIAGNHAAPAVFGSQFAAGVIPGRLGVQGSGSILVDGGTVDDQFDDETEIDLQIFLTTGSEANADFVSLMMPRIKINASDMDDPDTSVTRSFEFEALYNVTPGTGEKQSTLIVQDSAIP